MRGPCALAGIAFGAALALATGFASAQVPYQIGDNRGSVSVDLGVMESLGPTPTVPQMLRPGTPVGQFGYDSRTGTLASVDPSTGMRAHSGRLGSAPPPLGVDAAPAPDWLRRPDAPQYAPLPDTLQNRTTAPRARESAPTLTPPSATKSSEPYRQVREPAVTPPKSAQPQVPAAAAVPTPTPPKPPAPAAPSVTASKAVPAAKAPEPPKTPPLPKIPSTASTPVAAPPPVKAEPEPTTQVAAATSGPAAAPSAPSSQGALGDVVRVPFGSGQSTLPDDAKGNLDSLAGRLRKDETLRIQLLAYADGDEDNANKARRLSLSRALAVRAYLIDKQVQSTRMDVRALGNRAKDSPKDRVDVVLVSR